MIRHTRSNVSGVPFGAVMIICQGSLKFLPSQWQP
jgi:hypothetical protein